MSWIIVQRTMTWSAREQASPVVRLSHPEMFGQNRSLHHPVMLLGWRRFFDSRDIPIANCHCLAMMAAAQLLQSLTCAAHYSARSPLRPGYPKSLVRSALLLDLTPALHTSDHVDHRPVVVKVMRIQSVSSGCFDILRSHEGEEDATFFASFAGGSETRSG